MKFWPLILIICCLPMSSLLAETDLQLAESLKYRRPELENVPIETLIDNLQKKIEENPNNSGLHLNLARVYGMAYAKKVDQVEVNKPAPDSPWFGYEPSHVPYGEIVEASDKDAQAVADKNLKLSIEQFERAVELDEDNLTAQLGLAWSMDQAGKEMRCIELYRDIIKLGWEKEKEMARAGLGFHSIVAEAATYLEPKLDKEFDTTELTEIAEMVEQVSKIQRPITPIAIPLGADTTLDSVIDRSAKVPFDLDGSGIKKSWQWITPETGWLVYDRRGNGKIDSALQMFGNVTFWCFWENGYEALASLDSNQDGVLAGAELEHIAIWCDKDSDGVSDPGEVRSLASHGIVALNCQSQYDSQNQLFWNAKGVVLKNGTSVPSYDIVLNQRDLD